MAAHRYWRVYITAVNGNDYCNLMEVEFHTSIGGSAVGGGTAIASGSSFGWVPSNAFNGTTAGNGWVSLTPVTAEYIGLDYGAGNDKDIVEFKLYTRTGFPDGAPRNFLLQHSDDGSSWTTLYTVQEQAWTNGQALSFSANTSPGFKGAWRVVPTASASTEYSIAELEFRDSGGTDLTSSGGPVLASTYWDLTQTPPLAFDNSTSTKWSSINKAGTQFIGFWWGSTQDVRSIAITSRNDSPFENRTPTAFTVEYWDGSAWVVAYTASGLSAWSTSETRTFSFTTNTIRPVVFIAT